MSEPTEQDRETARQFASDIDGAPTPEYRDQVERELAAALAAERDKARAPFLALADELDVEMGTDDGVAIPSRTAYRIRRAAEDAL